MPTYVLASRNRRQKAEQDESKLGYVYLGREEKSDNANLLVSFKPNIVDLGNIYYDMEYFSLFHLCTIAQEFSSYINFHTTPTTLFRVSQT